MDKSAESSDSDSNSSTSWVFVDDATTLQQNTTNTFHLDCSREPIQELTEQDLLSGGSDFESDTDGVSVISESEVPTDDSYSNIQTVSTSSNETPEIKEETNLNDNNESNDNNEPNPVNNDANQEHSEPSVVSEEYARANNVEITKIMKPLHLLGVGFVFIAVCVASYNQIMTKGSEKDFKEDKLTLYDKVELGSNNDLGKLCDNNDKWENELIKEELNNNKKMYKVKRNSNKRSLIKDDVDENVEKIIDITVSCAFREKPTSNLVNKAIKECATKEYKRRKEEDLERESIPEKRKVEYHVKYMKLLNENGKPLENLYSKEILEAKHYEFAQSREKKDCMEDNDKKYEENTRKYKKRNERIKYNNRDESIADFEMKENVNRIQKKTEKYSRSEKYNKSKKYRSGEDISVKKEYNYKKDFKKNDEKDAENYKDRKPMKKSQKYDSDEKYHKDYKYKKYDFVNKDSKLENFDKRNKNDKNKNYKSEDFINNSDRIRHSKYKNKLNHNYIRQRKYNNSDGEWYINLHKARNEMRKQEHVSDWVFDRAYLRSKKRNKAQWYFKWMNVREQLRYKRSYKPYSS
ncbi:hypothetical protein ILUMI_21804 [Ignelater luminosus]|uniref:Uncharacterized protein n=1 Tax=Ignelater luminosus TaxID=2038154 RepID=A0A8K0FXP7_IGNLU|nr:hypothetical protein ILUMI_21804 [Ignelater luminosus]